MNLERYKEILNEFDLLVSVGKGVSQRLVGTRPIHAHHSYADPIFTKLLCHATSLRALSPRPTSTRARQLGDMPSACAVARCVIEAHDVLEYIALSELSEEEREFRVLVWELHDQQRRSKMLQAIQSQDERAIEIHSRAKELASKAVQHSSFKGINKQLQRRIRTGDAPSFLISQRELNAANEVNHDYHTTATMMLSQHVHTLPMSVHQLLEFRAGTPDALHLSSIPLQYSLGFIARAVLRMVETFPVANQNLTNEQANVFSRWNSVVKRGVSTSSWRGASTGAVA